MRSTPPRRPTPPSHEPGAPVPWAGALRSVVPGALRRAAARSAVWFGVLAAVAAAGPAPVQAPSPAPAAGPAVQAGARDPASEWAEWTARNARTSFNAHSAELALAALAKGLDDRLRPVALFALGASGERAMTPRLESWALEGGARDRQAAVLGLADGGFATFELLVRLARSSAVEVRDAALLSLVRSRGERERDWFEKLCEGDGPGAEACARLRAFAAAPAVVHDCGPARDWIQLRWEAARRYGLVDGEPWRAHLFAALSDDATFLDALVFGAASELRRLGTADHFLAVALEPGAPRRLRAVVNAIPSELDRMVAAGVWFPANQEEWAEILYGIDDRRLEGLTLELLRPARAFPDLAAYAAMLLVRGGSLEGLSLLELDVASKDPLRRQRIAETLGGSREVRYVELLEGLRGDEEPAVRAAAAIAQMRLGHVLAAESVRNTLADEPGADRAALVEGLARLAWLPEPAELLALHLPNFGPDERLAAAIELARGGDAREMATLQAALSEDVLRSPRGEHFVDAFAKVGSNADLQSLFALFPLDGAPAVNLQIGKAMCARRDPAVLPLLRTALWQGPFERSVLAAALMAHVAGIDSIRIELERPPRGARPEDIRRVGFALGEWGGTVEVERLARRRTAADPAVQGALLGALGARTR